MSEYANAVYTKAGVTFADGNEAYTDKNSLYGPELVQAVDDCYAQMLTDGVLLEPVTHTWDQATHTLTVIKHVSSKVAYYNAITFDTSAVLNQSTLAGWTFVGDGT